MIACDLDNTLLHSRGSKAPGDLCVERIGEKEQSFMTAEAVRLLREVQDRAELVPVTTRSIEQYLRIGWASGKIPGLAVTTNGGILLRGGAVDRAWQAESESAVRPWGRELRELYGIMDRRGGFSRCAIIDGMYAYAHYSTPVEAELSRDFLQQKTSLGVFCTGRKVYAFPPEINKGAALERLRRETGAEEVLCAGDSDIDLPMLESSDCALVPSAELAAQLRNSNHLICPAGMPFSEFVLETVLKRLD